MSHYTKKRYNTLLKFYRYMRKVYLILFGSCLYETKLITTILKKIMRLLLFILKNIVVPYSLLQENSKKLNIFVSFNVHHMLTFNIK